MAKLGLFGKGLGGFIKGSLGIKLPRVKLPSVSANILGKGLFRSKQSVFGKNLARAKKMFFDRKLIIDKVSAATRRVLSKFGSFVRRTARTSIRKGKGISLPGNPPKGHVGTLRKGILFGYDIDRESVAVGPIPANEGVAPEVLEYGGNLTIAAKRVGKTRRRVQVRGKYRPRPFIRPALRKELPKLSAMWADSVRA